MSDAPGITAAEAVRLLGIRPQTLYAYVSRGLVRASKGPGTSSTYRREDVERLAARKAKGRSQAAVAGQALDFGAPVLPSAIMLIRGREILLRGRPLAEMAQGWTLEEVAAHLWQCPGLPPFDPAEAAPGTPPAETPAHPIARALAVLPLAAAQDRTALTTDPPTRMQVAARCLRLVVAALAGTGPGAEAAHARIAAAWRKTDPRVLEGIRLALVLSADHELNASTFAVRVVASTGASLYMSVTAGLAAISGPRHGGMSERAAAMIDELLRDGQPERAVVDRHATGAPFYAFGHPLYPAGDPRAELLLDWLAHAAPRSRERRMLTALAATVKQLTGHDANIDYALVVLARVFGLPRHAPIALFAGGRTVGWIAHALEQAASRQLIRPRARYVGPEAAP